MNFGLDPIAMLEHQRLFEVTSKPIAGGEDGNARLDMEPADLDAVVGVPVFLRFDADAFDVKQAFVGIEPLMGDGDVPKVGWLQPEVMFECQTFTVVFHNHTSEERIFKCEVWGRQATVAEVAAAKAR